MTTIVWFRQDLRTRDNPALAAAAARGVVIPLFILEDASSGFPRQLGGASRWWLHHSLTALRKDLGHLALVRGSPIDVLPELIKKHGVSAVYWNRCYEPFAITRDTEMKKSLQKLGVDVQSFNGNLLHEPWEVTTGSGDPFKVYTPYWRASLTKPVAAPLSAPNDKFVEGEAIGDRLEDWSLLPKNPDWAADWQKFWSPGETGALIQFDEFASNELAGYRNLRDRPDLQQTSRLSPHLH
jgi:deoxyribodipyrimidine photo-lyase